MTPHPVADRAVKVTDRRVLRLFEYGQCIAIHVYAHEHALWNAVHEWLTFRERGAA